MLITLLGAIECYGGITIGEDLMVAVEGCEAKGLQIGSNGCFYGEIV
jgi:hypothetical protein